MKNIFFLFVCLPIIVVAQTKPKPKPTVNKPKTTIVAKPNPQVKKLVDSAYALYKVSKDAECEAIIKKILVLSPKNKEAFLLRANIAMYAEKYEDMWKNINLAYTNNPKEPEIFSDFAITHVSYSLLSDSAKRVLCRRTIKLLPTMAVGYASLGTVAFAGASFEEAIRFYNVAYTKVWKDNTAKTITKLYYARCQHELQNIEGAVETLNEIIPQINSADKYTAVFLRAYYQLEINNTEIKNDLDTLNAYAAEDLGIMKLNATYLFKTNKTDSACAIAKKIRISEGGENINLAEFCTNLQNTIQLKNGDKLVYETENEFFNVKLKTFDIKNEIAFNWAKIDTEHTDSGNIVLSKSTLDSAKNLQINYANGINETLNDRITFWLSAQQYNSLIKDSTATINTLSNSKFSTFAIEGHEQIDILNKNNKTEFIDCIRITNGYERIWYLNDPSNPLIVKMQLNNYKLSLFKIE